MFKMERVFDCLPHDLIEASALRPGDIAQVYRYWIFVWETEAMQDMVQPNNFAIRDHKATTIYVKPDQEIKIISRRFLDKEELSKITDEINKERMEREEAAREEDREERRQLRAQRDELNRLIDDDEDQED